MKVTVIAPTTIPSRHANSIQVMKMTQAIAGLGHAVLLIAPMATDSSKTSESDIAIETTWQALGRHYGLEKKSIQEFPVEWLTPSPRWRRYDYSIQAMRRAQKWGADLIYTRLPQAAALSSQMGISTILETHDLPRGKVGPWLFRRFLTGKGACRLVVITSSLAADLQKRYHIPAATSQADAFTLVLPDGVDLARFTGIPLPEVARQSLETASVPLHLPERFTVGYTGHLYPGRGVEMILELADRLTDITFLIVGGEPQDVKALSRQAQDRQLENLIFTGFVPNAELPVYQAACDVLLMPYQRRVAASSGGNIAPYLSPMKVFEYMACGRPILSSNLPVLGEVLNSHNAILLPPEDLEGWIDALRDLRSNPERRIYLSEQARSDAQQYSWDARAGRILNISMDK